MRIMFVGTSSNAGKTTIAAMFCRYLRSKAVMVSPFKAFNMSSKSFMTENGEMGIGQAVQAWASDIKPNVRMNPVLVKVAGGKLKTIVNGEERNDLDRNSLFEHALSSFDEICERYDAVVAEGSGSPAEINLRGSDIANARFARSRKIPMILIGNIEKGGVFAGIYGTWLLMEKEDRDLMKGFIINKYYGDDGILKSGIEEIEALTGMKCFGILPYMKIMLPEEDAGDGVQCSEDNIDTFVSQLDKLLEEVSGRLDLEGIMKAASE
ncbi:MAG: AAA family ATPase [Methanomassiliicoccaceae archaeon]|nr:AAA family ATPase [Methanomassiliicoccaceae archaeon]